MPWAQYETQRLTIKNTWGQSLGKVEKGQARSDYITLCVQWHQVTDVHGAETGYGEEWRDMIMWHPYQSSDDDEDN